MKNHIAAFALLSSLHALPSLALSQEAPEKSLWQAASDGDVETVEAHIAAETDLDEKHTTGYAPLHLSLIHI